MEALGQVLGLCLLVSVAASVLRRSVPELGLLLAIAALTLGSVLLLSSLGELISFAGELRELTGLAPATFAPLLKVTLIALLTRIGGALCADAGQSALARLLESAGALCALGCALPLVRAVVDLLKGWL